jgi:NADH dehydrogenase
MKVMKKVLIVGGGFAGIKCALDLSRQHSNDFDITLVSDKSHFEYHAYLYRVVTGRTPLEVCVPLAEIFKGTKVKIVNDTITGAELNSNTVHGLFGSSYHYDFLVLAVGSQTEYFGIEGLKNYSYGFKSINEALRLKKHIHEMFTKCAVAKSHEEKQRCMVQIAVVGAGPSGVELAGELAQYTKRIAKYHQVDPRLVSVDLIEGAPRVLPMMSEEVSSIALSRLKQLGVDVMLNKKVIKEDLDALYLNDTAIKAKTIIWTAGTKINELYAAIPGLTLNKKGQVIVNDYLNPEGFTNVYVGGDAAQTKYSGLAQTAVVDGAFIAQSIIHGNKEKYVPKQFVYALPIGQGWTLYISKTIITGYLGWVLRRTADFKFFASILPLRKAMDAFGFTSQVCETCDICSG